jgi:hypothetical protein
MCMQVVQGQHAYARRQKTTCPHAYTTVLNTAPYTLKHMENFEKQEFDSLLNLHFVGCMSIGEKGSMKTLILWSQKTLLLSPY